MKQVLRDQDNLVSRRDLQERYSIEQDQHCRTIRRHFYQRSHKSCFWISQEEDHGMFSLSFSQNSNLEY
jgi:hypothetical protein